MQVPFRFEQTKMQAAKKKISNLASVANEHITICKASVEEKAELATGKTAEEKQVAKERRKAREAEAKKELHEAKARHAAHKLNARHSRLHLAGHHHNQRPVVGGTQPVVGTQMNQPVGTTATMAGTTAPAYPLGSHPPGATHV